MFGVKIYVNVYRFLRNYFGFFTFCCSLFTSHGFLFTYFLRKRKSAISGTLLKEDGDIAL